MDPSTFWKIIETSRRKAKGDLDEQLEQLRARLEELDPAEIVEFGTIFNEHSNRSYTWELWAAAYLIGGGCSDDGFQDFRGWLISRGEKVYERALKDAESLARVVKDDEDCQYEGFQYVAAAWFKLAEVRAPLVGLPRGPNKPEAQARVRVALACASGWSAGSVTRF